MNLIKEVLESPALLKEVYGDLAKPGVQQVGKALSAIIGLGNTILWPVMLANEKARIALENNLEKYRIRISQSAEDDVCSVPPEIGIPIAEKLSYVTNDELSDMYVELLAKASAKSTCSLSHPSFVNVLNNISPDEALLIQRLKARDSIPFIEVRLQIPGKMEWNIIRKAFSELDETANLVYPNNIVAYISNFEGLGLIDVRTDIHLGGENTYPPLEQAAKSKFIINGNSETTPILIFQKGVIDITPFGALFINACANKA